MIEFKFANEHKTSGSENLYLDVVIHSCSSLHMMSSERKVGQDGKLDCFGEVTNLHNVNVLTALPCVPEEAQTQRKLRPGGPSGLTSTIVQMRKLL